MNQHDNNLDIRQLCSRLLKSNKVNIHGHEFYEVVNYGVTLNPARCVFQSDSVPLDECYLAAQLVWYLRGQPFDTTLLESFPGVWSRMKWVRGTVDNNSNYGRYIFQDLYQCKSQFYHCLNLLEEDPTTRQAIIVINSPDVHWSDTSDHICTTSFQFLIRDGQLHMITTMRSNELLFNFRTDVHFFTFLQQLMLVFLKPKHAGLTLGDYHHNVGSMHVKAEDGDKVDLLEHDVCSAGWGPLQDRHEANWLMHRLPAIELVMRQNHRSRPSLTAREMANKPENLIPNSYVFSNTVVHLLKKLIEHE